MFPSHDDKDEFFSTLPLILFALFFLFDPLLLNPVDYGLLALCIGSLALIYWLLDVRVNRTVLRVGTVILCLMLLSAIYSGYFWNAIEYSFVVGCAVLLLSMIHGDTRLRLRGPIPLTIVLLGLVFLLGIFLEYSYQVQLFGWYGLARLPVRTFRNPNVLGRFFGLVSIVCISSRGNHWIRNGLAALFTVALLLSGSRGAILALILALSYFVFLTYSDRVMSRFLLVGGGLLILVVMVILIGWPTYVTNLQRINLAVESLVMANTSPWFGVGGWNFGLVYPSVSFDGQWQRHAHALPFQILAEFGLIGFSAAVGVVILLVNSGPRARWIPVLVFLGFHELVDTMIWIPGITIFGLIALKPLRPSVSGTRGSRLLAVLGAVVLLGGALVWGIGRTYRQGRINQQPTKKTVLSPVKTTAAFPVFHDIVRQVEKGRRVDLAKLGRVLHFNQYDPYYFWFAGKLLMNRDYPRLGRSALERYVKMDPHGMLGLTRSDGYQRAKSVGDSIDKLSKTPTFGRIFSQPYNPERYLPVILQTMERKNYGRALEQIQYLARFPKVDREVMGDLDKLLSRLPKRMISRDGRHDMAKSTTQLPRLIRQQFHRFFYRRPGNDYVSFQ